MRIWWRLRRRSPIVFGCILVLAASCIAGVEIGLAISESGEPSIAWQITRSLTVFFGGLAGSWILTKYTTIRHIKSAFRRLRSIVVWLDEISQTAKGDDPTESERALQKIEALASTSRQAASDALEDWADLAPDDVADLRVLPHGQEDGYVPLTPGSISRNGGVDD